MKNLKGVIGYALGILFSVLVLAWNAMAFYTVTVSAYGQKVSTSQSIYDALSMSGFTGDMQTAKIFAIITLVFACILAVTCVIGLLHELGVIKFKYITYINYAVAGLVAVFALLAIIFCGIACSDANKLTGSGVSTSVGAGLVMNFISAVVALAGILFATINGKKKKAE